MMESLITNKMINGFNDILQTENSIIRLKKDGNSVNIVFLEDQYIHSFILNPTDKFYKKLEDYFTTCGITGLKYNNTGSCFWKFG